VWYSEGTSALARASGSRADAPALPKELRRCEEIEFDDENGCLLTRAVLMGRDLQYRHRQGAALSSIFSQLTTRRGRFSRRSEAALRGFTASRSAFHSLSFSPKMTAGLPFLCKEGIDA
jgi:hypothetical protein